MFHFKSIKMSIVALLLLVLFGLSDCVIYKLNNEDHARMPPVLRLDPYETCMRDPGSVYCTAYMTYVSDQPSALLTQMQEYSEHTTTHFNHTRVIYGTCLTRECAAFYNTTQHPKHALEACRNKTLYDEYKLKAIVEDTEDELSCMGAGFDEREIGVAHIVVAAVCMALVLLNFIGSLFDVFCPKMQGVVPTLLRCFSICRNWRKLVAPPGGRDPRQIRFKGLYGIKAVLSILVITAHSMLPIMLLNENTKFFEDEYDNLPLHIMLNGTLIMQIFLIMSALLLVYNAEIISEKHALTWNSLPYAFVKRWFRLTPSYALVLAVTATWMQFLGSGPLWDKLVTLEVLHCQRDWWTHMIYINNYFSDSHCMPQSWYLATDTQLFCLGLMVYVSCRSARARKLVLALLIVGGSLVPGIHTYLQDLDAALLVSPKAAAGFFVSDPTFNQVYKRGHTNVSCYVIGMALGYFIYHLQNSNFDITRYKCLRPLHWAGIPLGSALVLSGRVWYADAPRAPVLWRAAAACLLKPAFGLINAGIIFGLIFKLENYQRCFFEWRGWTSVGRVSYSAYLLHVFFIRTAAGRHTVTVQGTYLRMCEIVMVNLMITYTAAYVFWLMVESPLSELASTLLGPRTPEPLNEASTKEDNTQAHTKL